MNNNTKKYKILVTGTAGFIGFHLVEKLIKNKELIIIGFDNINDYYDINLKYNRLKEHGILKERIIEKKLISSEKYLNYSFVKVDLVEHDFIVKFMVYHKFDYVINLAAQAGVRYSIDNPRIYTDSNISGFLSILEGCRHSNPMPKHLIYASTSSVYGLNKSLPFSEVDITDHQIAYYAVTKKANELMAHSYSHLFKIPTTGLRFFTVYGPWGRPDMALFSFTNSILKNQEIDVYNHGNMFRDFTYINDIIEGITKLMSEPPCYNSNWDHFEPEMCTSSAPYQIFNIGNSTPVKLSEYIKELEQALGKKAKIIYKDLQPGDVESTHADINRLKKYIGFTPCTSVKFGIQEFVNWYLKYYSCN